MASVVDSVNDPIHVLEDTGMSNNASSITGFPRPDCPSKRSSSVQHHSAPAPPPCSSVRPLSLNCLKDPLPSGAV